MVARAWGRGGMNKQSREGFSGSDAVLCPLVTAGTRRSALGKTPQDVPLPRVKPHVNWIL